MRLGKKFNEYMNCIFMVELRVLDIYFRGIILIIIFIILLKNKEIVSLKMFYNYFKKNYYSFEIFKMIRL